MAEHVKAVPFKGRLLSLISVEHINRLLLYDVSPAVREDEIYALLRDISKGLYGVTIFDANTPQGVLSAGVCLIEYEDYSSARAGMLSIIQRHAELRAVLSPTFKVMWAEPLFDYFAEFAQCTKALHVKHLPLAYPTEDLYKIFAKHGNVLKIRRYSDRALIYYSKPSEARGAYDVLTSELKLPTGAVCRLSLTQIKLKDSPQGSSESVVEVPTINLLEMDANETMGLTQQLLYGTIPANDPLLNKARAIVKRAAFSLAAQKEYAVPSQPPQPQYDNVPVVIDTTSLQGKRPTDLEREDYQYKKLKPEPMVELSSSSSANPFIGTTAPTTKSFYDQRYIGMVNKPMVSVPAMSHTTNTTSSSLYGSTTSASMYGSSTAPAYQYRYTQPVQAPAPAPTPEIAPSVQSNVS